LAIQEQKFLGLLAITDTIHKAIDSFKCNIFTENLKFFHDNSGDPGLKNKKRAIR
jgi:hypothetical protein